MKYSGDMSFFIPGYDYISLHLKNLETHLAKACAGDDMEDVHQIRVSCRRLLAGIEFFNDFFDKKHTKLWRKKIQYLLKAMGDARDLDVQIMYLEDRIVGLFDNQAKYFAGLKDLLQRRQVERLAFQPEILHSIEAAKSDGYLKDIRKDLKRLVKNNKRDIPGNLTTTGLELLHGKISKNVKIFFDCEDCLEHAEDKRSHHNMRIKAKQLRYALELSDVVMGGTLESFVNRVKKIQAMLGEIHDCDVWEESLVDHMRQEREKVSEDYRYAYLLAKVVPGLEYLLDSTRKRRADKFVEFKEYWQELKVKEFWVGLEDVFSLLNEKDVELNFL